MESLDGRTVVITGAASGLGRAFAEGFRADGADVLGCDIDEDGLDALAERGIHVAVADVIPGMTNTAIWGRDMPAFQDPADVYPCARVVATLPDDGPTGTVFYRGEPYAMFDPANAERMGADLADVRRRRGDA